MAMVLLVILNLAWACAPVVAQDDDLPIYKRDAFDRLILNDENNSAVVEIFPLDTIDRRQPVPNVQQRNFKIRRIQDSADRMYSVSGKHIVQFELFHEILLGEAKKLIRAGKIDAAFPYLSRLRQDYPDVAGLNETVEQFFFADAKQLFQLKRYDESLHALDEIYKLNPNRPGLDRVLRANLSKIIRTEYAAANYESVVRKTAYARERYGDATKATVDEWEARLKADAAKQLAIGRQAFSIGNASKALAASRRAGQIWPGLAGVAELNRQILSKYPRVRVGVTQAFTPNTEGSALLDWASRRSRPLVAREVVAFQEFTSEGGRYASPLGKLNVSPNRKQITLQLAASSTSTDNGIGAFELSRSLLYLADKRNAGFSPRWAEFLKSIEVPSPSLMQIHLTRPTLRPEALVPPLTLESGAPALTAGQFEVTTANPGELTYQLRTSDRNGGNGIREIVEQWFDDPADATEAMLAGDLDVIDRVNPMDLGKLRSRSNIRVRPYRVPSVHFLVFNDREPLIRSSTFRRGLLYGINRQEFLQSDVIAGGSDSTAQILSGPLPIGITEDDPLGYANNRRIKPRAYDPSLSLVLLRLAQAERTMFAAAQAAANTSDSAAATEVSEPAADRTDEGESNEVETSQRELVDGGDDDSDSAEQKLTAPAAAPLPALTLAHPATPLARTASTAIATDLRRVGLTITLRELSPGASMPVDNDWDVLYVETVIEEPLVDIPELVLGQSIMGRHGGLVWQAVRSLQETQNLSDAREQFERIHKLAFDHTPLLPLWQIVEHCAFRASIQGVPETPVSLYQDVEAWRMAP